MIGQSIAHYRVTGKLGAGGMGEVYRATDSRLNRDVAVKVLPQEFAQDAQRMARFEREAQVLAALNHPHIAAIFGLEQADGSRALVMELVEGPTLAARVAQSAMPVEEALAIAKQIAEALEYAHERGIIHRDLKPANIKFTPDGGVKLLDFGLAKALADEKPSGDMSTSPTLSMAATRAGLILGTAAYMSPEQARGKAVDRRADIWSFGVVLFEMLSGKQIFGGETVSDSMAAVITREPDWDGLPAGVPQRVRQLLRRCLAKDPKQRLQAIGEARIALENAGAMEAESPAAARVSGASGWRTALPWAVAGALTLALAFAVLKWRAAAQPTPVPRMHFAVQAPPDWSMTLVNYPPLALSPDGSRLAFIALRDTNRQIFVRNIDSLEAVALTGTDGAQDLTFSPDGQWIAFFADLKLKKIPVAGGPPHVLAEASSDPRGLTWAEDDSIIFSTGATVGLMRVAATGGVPQPLTTLNAAAGERTHRWPHAVAGGGSVIFTVGTLTSSEFYDDANIEAVSLATGQRHVVLQGASMARQAPGCLIYGRGGILYAAPFDSQDATVSGQGTPLIQNVGGDSSSGAVGFSVSGRGSIAYVPGGAELLGVNLAWADRSGKMELLKGGPQKFWDVSPSPNGQQIVMTITEGRTSDIWTKDVATGAMNRMTFAGTNRSPVWTRDGKRLIFASTQGGTHFQLHSMPADGSRPPELLVPSPVQVLPNSVSPDGRVLAVNYLKEGDDSDIYMLSLEGERKFTPFFAEKGDQYQATFSPDGRRLAYTSAETGSFQVYVQPYPATGGRWQISVNGGRNPRWSANGTELFYETGVIMAVKVDTKAGFRAGTPVPLFGGFHVFPGAEWNFDVSRDARFLVSRRDAKKEDVTQINVLLNWAQPTSPAQKK